MKETVHLIQAIAKASRSDKSSIREVRMLPAVVNLSATRPQEQQV